MRATGPGTPGIPSPVNTGALKAQQLFSPGQRPGIDVML
jgi:hypothetical protein